MAAAALDTAYLAGFCGVPQPDLDTLVASPTTDLVTRLLQSLTPKAQQYEEALSERRRLEVELENAVHSGESRARGLKSNADKALADVESLRKKLNEEENARQSIQDELRTLKSSSSTSSSEIDAFKTKVAKLESSNRDTLALLDSKSSAHDKLAEELAKQQASISSLRREVDASQERIRSAQSDANSSKFRESSLRKEIEVLKTSNDWLDNELKTKGADHSKFRKEKNARISDLQRQNEDAESKLASARRTESTLRQRLEELSQKLDDSFNKIHQMQEDATRTEESFRAELGNARRLAELQEQSASTAKNRVRELEEQNEQTRMDASDELSQMQAELETERQTRDAAEQKVDELEQQVDRLQATATDFRNTSRPATPSARLGAVRTPLRGASPSGLAPGSAQSQRLTFTQLFSDFKNAESALAEEKRRSARYKTEMEEMIEDLAKAAPERDELVHEKNKLESQVANASEALDKVRAERESFRKEARKCESEISTLRRQEQLIRGQVRDREAQIRFLTVVTSLYEQGDPANELQREQIERLAMADFSDEAFAGMTDTDRFISQRLVTFRNIAELTTQNATLLDLTRKLGQQMEGDEAKAKQEHQQHIEAELKQLQSDNDQLRFQLEQLVTQSNSFVKERDLFKRRLEEYRRQTLSSSNGDAMFSQSLNALPTPRNPGLGGSASEADQTQLSQELAAQMKLTRDLQAHSDAYKHEAAATHQTLRNQIDSLAKDKGELQGEIARVKSQLTLAQERYDMLQANFSLAKAENEEMQKRASSLEGNAAKQEMRGQQAAEDLIQAQELVDGLRGENANLKAEKELWKRIEARLNEDNQSLIEERARLNKLTSDTQSLSNQREAADSETRRALQAQVESLDQELQLTKRKLDEETTEAKQASRRREFEQEQSRSRIDDLVKALSSTKEELVAVKTTRDQVQARVEELKIELRSAQERAEALQPRPTPRPTTTAAAATGSDESGLNHEQELMVQVSDLKRELDLTKGELESANAQIEQYKAIAQSSEEALNNLQESQDQYTEDMEKTMSEKESSIASLQQRVNDISTELSETIKQLDEARASSNEFNSRLEQQKTTYEDALAHAKDDCERYKETARFHQEDLKAQAEIAQRAQQSYETELVRHAEAAKSLQAVRAEFNEIKLEASTAKANAEAVKATMVQNEESWASSRDNYERELGELRKNREDVANQNKLLHQQLENVSTQIADLQQRRVNAGESTETEASTDSGLQNLQEVIKYLRREKEIVDVQYELSIQEAKRLKQQLDYAQSQLDDARLRLDQERQRQSDKERTSQSHAKLVETLNEINVYRESNASLRSETTRVRSQLEEQTKKVEELRGQIEPLQTSVRELENQLETAQGENKLLQEDRDRWQKRTQDILQKYDRVDPAELEGLRAQLSGAQQERDEATSARDAKQQECDEKAAALKAFEDSLPQQIQDARADTRNRLQDQFKERSKQLSARVKNAENEAKAAREELEQVKTELLATQQARDEALAGSGQGTAAPQPQSDAVMQDQPAEPEGEEGEVLGDEQQTSQTPQNAGDAAQLQETVNQLQTRAQQLESRVSELEQELENSQSQLRSALQAQETAHSNEAPGVDADQSSEHLEKLQADLKAAQEELQALQSQSQIQDPTQTQTQSESNGPAPERSDSEAVSQQVAAIRAELEEAHNGRIQKLEQDYERRILSMREQLNQKLKEGRQKFRDEVKEEHDAALQQLRDSHAEETTALKNQHAQAMQELEAAHKASLADAKPGDAGAEAAQPPAQGMSSDEVKKFIATNPTIKEILNRNIKAKVEQERETSKKSVESLTQTHAAELEEWKKKAEKSRELGIDMESKKWKVKINMMETRAKTATAKIEIVSKAATDTPDKPVAEVWAIAKDFRPQPVQNTPSAATRTTGPTPQSPSVPQTPQAQMHGASGAAQPASAAPGTVTQTQSVVQSVEPQSDAAPQGQASRQSRPPSQEPERPLARPPSRPPSRQGSRPPSRQGQQNGTGPAALKALQAQATSIPQPRGGGSVRGGATTKLPDAPLGQTPANRGGTGIARGIPRGGRAGSGIGRGGPAGRGNLNPQAGQFAPQGAKRPREDSDGAGVGRAGKIPRGGGNA